MKENLHRASIDTLSLLLAHKPIHCGADDDDKYRMNIDFFHLHGLSDAILNQKSNAAQVPAGVYKLRIIIIRFIKPNRYRYYAIN